MAFGGWPEILQRVSTGQDLDYDSAKGALAEVLGGESTEAQIAAFAVALRTKGETSTEVAAMVDAMLAASAPLELSNPKSTIDIVGTGGSKALPGGAFNVSTMAAIVSASAGATVCKHGNRKASSTSGSTDLLEALGVKVELDGVGVRACVDEVGVGFAFARTFHPAMRFAGPVRAQLGIPTVFNILGPLSHPGHVGHQVVGVADPARVSLVADVLAQRGVTAWVVHGSDGLDEITTTGPTSVVEVLNGFTREFELTPQSLGIPTATPEQISVGDPAENALVARALMEGQSGPLADIVVVNAAAALVVSGEYADMGAGMEAATAVLSDGRAATTAQLLVDVSNKF